MTATAEGPARADLAAAPAAIGQVDHVALTVIDLDVSETFYTAVLGFVVVMDVPGGRICMHPESGFVLALLVHEGARGGSFSELETGVDHLGFAASSRQELEQWERHFEAHGVRFTPIRDETFGSHLNFRDPDGIALELTTSNELMGQARAALRAGPMTAEAIGEFVAEHVGPEVVHRPAGPRDRSALDRARDQDEDDAGSTQKTLPDGSS